ncbi:cystathionine beta-synthase-like isoform X2, partial [Dinothrombium tinctorium]
DLQKLAEMSMNNGVPDFIPPNLPSKCTWSLHDNATENPHRSEKLAPKPKILSNVLQYIGDTPLVKLNRIPKEYGVKCEVLCKCEFFSAGGSVKDRIALRMIEEAEREGRIQPGWTIIEPTSGNTGIGLALAAAVKGYRCIIVMTEKCSSEKGNILKALGAEVIRTPTSANFDDPQSNIRVAQRLQKSIPKSIVLDQYRNPNNPLAHYYTTAEEILAQCDGKVDMVVMGAGTGGTVTGIGRKIKERLPHCKVIGVDPYGSILAEPADLNATDTTFYEVEGIGYDFIPSVLDRSVVDMWIKTGDKESLNMARDLISKEGMLCGGSSGSAVVAAMQAAKELDENQRCVVILADGVRNYLTKFVDSTWMAERGFRYESEVLIEGQKPWFWNMEISSIAPESNLITIGPEAKVSEAIGMMKQGGFDQIPVVSATGNLYGMVTVAETMKNVVAGNVRVDDAIEKIAMKEFPTIERSDTLGRLTTMLKLHPYVVVVDTQPDKQRRLVGIVTHVDVLNYLIIADNYEH